MFLCHFQKQLSDFSSGITRRPQKNACLIPHYVNSDQENSVEASMTGIEAAVNLNSSEENV